MFPSSSSPPAARICSRYEDSDCGKEGKRSGLSELMRSVEVEKEVEMEEKGVRSWNRVPREIPVESRDQKGSTRKREGAGKF